MEHDFTMNNPQKNSGNLLLITGNDAFHLLTNTMRLLKQIMFKTGTQIYTILNQKGFPTHTIKELYGNDFEKEKFKEAADLLNNWDNQKYIRFFLNVSSRIKPGDSVKARSRIQEPDIFGNMNEEEKIFEKFSSTFGKAGFGKPRLRTVLHELKYYRNLWAHQKKINLEEINRLLESILIMLDAVGFPKESNEFKKVFNTRLKIIQLLAQKTAFLY